MNAERARDLLRSLPHVVESVQWGNNLVYFIGDKTAGGKMFALIDLDGDLGHGVAMFCAGPERFHELLESNQELFPARYLARASWVAAKRWSALRDREWAAHFEAAHAIVLAKMTKKARAALGT